MKWSSNGKKIYLQQGDAEEGLNVFELDLASKQPTRLTNLDPSSGAQFFSISLDENRIAYSAFQDKRLHIFVVPVGGGTPQRITDDGEANDEYPFWLPDGQRIIYSSERDGVFQACIAHLDEGRTERLNVDISDTLISDVAADGTRILYQQSREESDIWKIGTDGKNETQITSDSRVSIGPDVSPDGKSVIFQSTSEAKHLLKSAVMDNQHINIAAPGIAPIFSPDGEKIAFMRGTGNILDLWITGRNGAGERRLTTGGTFFTGYVEFPYSLARNFTWSPDGTSLVYCEKKDGFWNFWQAPADGSGAPRQISNNREKNILFYGPAFASDGKRIAWTSSKPLPDGNSVMSLYLWNGESIEVLYESDAIIRLIGWAGNNLVVALTREKSTSKPVSVLLKLISADDERMKDVASIDAAYFNNIQLSHDGSRIALSAREGGKDDIRIISIPSRKKVRIPVDLDQTVYISGIAWSPDGKDVYFSKQKVVGTISMVENFR